MNKGMHEFCRLQLALARHEASKSGIVIPSHITALSDGNSQFFMEATDTAGDWVSACCCYQARAKFIRRFIDAATEPRRTLDDQAIKMLFKIAESLDSISSREDADDSDLLSVSVNIVAASAILSGLDSSAVTNEAVRRVKSAIDRTEQIWPDRNLGGKRTWAN